MDAEEDKINEEEVDEFAQMMAAHESRDDALQKRKEKLMEQFVDESLGHGEDEAHEFRGSVGNDPDYMDEQMLADDPMMEYQRLYDAYQMEMVKYRINKALYDKFQEKYKHVDFTLLSFLPEIRETEYYQEQKKEKLNSDLRFVRTRSLIGKEETEGFQNFDEKLDRKLSKVPRAAGQEGAGAGGTSANDGNRVMEDDENMNEGGSRENEFDAMADGMEAEDEKPLDQEAINEMSRGSVARSSIKQSQKASAAVKSGASKKEVSQRPPAGSHASGSRKEVKKSAMRGSGADSQMSSLHGSLDSYAKTEGRVSQQQPMDVSFQMDESMRRAKLLNDQEPILVEMDGMQDCLVKDPVAEGIRHQKLLARRAKKEQLIQQRDARLAEEARREKERLANLPPPPIQPRRLEFKFDGGRNKGNTFRSETSEANVALVSSAVCTNFAYVLEDFPEDADDIPGTFAGDGPQPIEE